jgi:hypothetical protein
MTCSGKPISAPAPIEGRFLGIRIVPSMHGDSVKIAVTAMLKDKKKL